MTILTTLIYSLFLSIQPINNGFLSQFAFANNDNPIEIKIGSTFQLEANEKAILKSNNIIIDLVNISDSRCPEGMNCFRAGELEVDLLINQDGEERVLKLMIPTWEKGGVSEAKLTSELTISLVGPSNKNKKAGPIKAEFLIK